MNVIQMNVDKSGLISAANILVGHIKSQKINSIHTAKLFCKRKVKHPELILQKTSWKNFFFVLSRR